MKRKKLDKNKKKVKPIVIDNVMPRIAGNVMRTMLEMGCNVLHIDKVEGEKDTFRLTKIQKEDIK